MLRLLFGLIIATFAFAADPYADTVQPVLRRYCLGCHSAQSASAGFQLDTLLKDPNPLKQRERWEQIARRIRSGEMPPQSAPKPPAAQGQLIVQWIETSYDKLDRTQLQDPGRVTARRLSRYE